MSYTWSSPVQVTVQRPAPPALSISRVWIDVSKTTVNVNEQISISIWVELNRAVLPGEVGEIEFALAINDTSNIVKKESVTFSANIARYSHTIIYSFSSPGTYKVYGGARLVLPATAPYMYYTPIVWGSRSITVLGHPSPSPDITNLLMFITGAIIGVEAYKKWQEVKGKIPRIAIVRR